MRARNIKPGFFKNEYLAEMPAFVRLLFIGLWTLADREGRIEDRPKRIKLELFPYDSEDVNSGLEALKAAGFIDRYQAEGIAVIQIANFLKHQSPHGTEKDSILPDQNGLYTLHERSRNGCVTGKKATVNVKPDANNVIKPLSNGDSTVNEPSSNGEPTVNKRPDSPNPDSLNPESERSSPSDLSPADAGDLSANKREAIPCQAVVDAYNETCSELFPAVAKLTDQRRKAIKRAWNADKTNPTERARTNSLDYWRRYFGHCLTITFFRKAASGELSGEHVGWKPDFDFLIREKTWLGVLEGKYE